MEYWQQLDQSALTELQSKTLQEYQKLKGLQLKLDMTRGKPSAEQLDLSSAMLSLPGQEFTSPSGTDCRNYGGLEGLTEAKQLFAPMMDVEPEELLVGGNASLTLMHDTVWRALTFGVPGSEQPWGKQDTAFICLVPGYDRHFSLLEHFGIRMINVPLTESGPDIEKISQLVQSDASIKGMFCVPKYSNPTGHVYSEDVVKALASMKTAATDFRIFWDNAYAIHHLGGEPAPLAPLLKLCQEAGNPDRALIFGSTSKITFAGSGLAMMAASSANRQDTLKHLSKQTIGPDKLNILRHVRFFGDYKGLLEHMNRHAEILAPKFAAVHRILETHLAPAGIAQWSSPKGGYFISLDTLDGCAQKVVDLAADVGVKLTKAGATFPYGKDPRDNNLRLAPSLPPLQEVEQAMEAVAICIKLASVEALLNSK